MMIEHLDYDLDCRRFFGRPVVSGAQAEVARKFVLILDTSLLFLRAEVYAETRFDLCRTIRVCLLPKLRSFTALGTHRVRLARTP